MSEKLFERKLRETIKKLGGIALKIYCASFTGLPDRLVLLPIGRLWFVELKSPGKKPGKRQVIVHRILTNLGFPPIIIDSEITLKEFLEITIA